MREAMARDVRFALRGLRRTPGFTAAAVLTLALGIGATTAVFSVVYGVIFRPLPFPAADRLVQVVQVAPGPPGSEPVRAGLSPDQVAEWRATSRTLAQIGYYSQTAGTLTGVPVPARLNGAGISVPLFRALGVAPFAGRLFVDEDEAAGNEHVIVLAYDTWVNYFGASLDVLETPIALSGVAKRVVGIMPPGFGFPSMASPFMSANAAGELSDAPEFWTPLVARARPAGPATGGMTLVPTFALLQPDATLESATAEVNTLMPARAGTRWPVELVSARVEQARAVRPVLLLFQAAVLVVLFIACANVINLLLARVSNRRQELAVRRALGARRSELARFAVTEGLIIGIIGGALGSMVAFQIVALVRTLPPFVLPRVAEIRVDSVILAAACAISIAAGVIVGLTTAVRALRSDLDAGSLRGHSRAASAGRHHRPSRALVVLQTAASVILLAGAGLLLTSFVRLTSVERGFDPEDVFTFRISIPARYQGAEAQAAFHDAFGNALRRVPGVTSVAASPALLGRYATGFTLEANGRQHKTAIAFQPLTPDMFETLQVPLRGRDFTMADRARQAHVAIVTELFARRFFPDVDPVGQRIKFQDWPSLDIVGVAGDTRTRELDGDIRPAVYLPFEMTTDGFGALTYAVRAPETPDMMAAVRRAATALDPSAVVFDATWMEPLLARSVVTPKLYSATGAGFAAVAVVLAALGLFSVLSYSIASRTREFGIRIALGASGGRVVATVLREAVGTVLLGIVLGIAGAAYLSKFLESLLFGVTPRDPATLGGVAVLFLAVATLASYLPARRATQVDPIEALRAE
jgi:predicted permease